MKDHEKRRRVIPYWKNQEMPNPGELYTDPLFPPNINSILALDKNGKPIDNKAYKENSNQIKNDEIEFIRAIDIFGSKYKLFSEKIEMADVIQGSIGDCYFLSSVANLCKFPGLINSLFKTKEMNRDGYYEIYFYIDGRKQIVIVDDYFPVYKKNKWPCFAQPNGKEIWVMLLEKAWAKINGGYVNIIGGMSSQALECLTGFGSLVYKTSNMKPEELNNCKGEIIKNIKIAKESHCLISCATGDINDKELEKVGLIKTHEYTIINISQISTSEGKSEYLLRLRNPWGKEEWTGEWSDKSSLWTESLKNQLNFRDKKDGIFFICEDDFFKYFKYITICYILYDSTSIKYSIEGEDNLKNASVFNIETENDGFLSVLALRKNWRTNRELRGKELPTHISIVKYNPKEIDRLKKFSDYSGTYTSYETCTLNIKVSKGNYLIYVYRYLDNNDIFHEQSMNIKIICSAKFKHAQMSYDERNKGFPLLQNIILQTEINKRKLNSKLGEDCNFTSQQIGGNGIIGYIYFYSTPGFVTKFTVNQKELIMLTPYLGASVSSFQKIIPSGKYLILLGLLKKEGASYLFQTNPFITSENLKADFDDNEIDLSLYTNINNDIKNEKFKQRKTKGIKRASQQLFFDISDGNIQYKSLKEIDQLYHNFIKLLDEIPKSKMDPFLKWGIMRGEYVTYVGQFKDKKKEGKGLFINPNNIFAGEFKNDLQNGIGYTYNIEFQKLYHCNYVNGVIKGKIIKESETDKEEEEMNKLEKELFTKNIHNLDNGERYQGDFDTNNLKEGKGIQYYNNGDKYIGEWKNNLKEGNGTYFYNNGNKYVGEWKNDKKEGKGRMYRNDGKIFETNWKNDEIDGKIKLYYNDGQRYEGDYKNDKIEGNGIFYYNSGDKYEGEWKNNKKEGKGIFNYNNGEKYEGNWKEDKKEGKGIFYSINGEKYDGNWKNDLREGKGTYYGKDEKKIYEGDWKEGKMEGKGIFYFNNNDIYEGDWKKGEMDGKGIFLSKDGEKYDGDWKIGLKDGKGAYYGKDGKKVYEGDWKEDKMEGKGIFYYSNGKYDGYLKNGKKDGKGTFLLDNGEKYEGDWKEDKMNGKGIFYYKNGKYDGDWIEGKMEGNGIFYYNNGSKYEGHWKNEKKDGKGIFYGNDGIKVYEGDWKEDKIEGRGIYYFKNGKYDGEMKDGKMEGRGIFYYSNGKYEGDWINNLKTGKGAFYLNDGKKIYEGDWKNDIKDGKGIYYYNNGKYEGDIKNDKKDGKGTYIWNNGDKYEGYWKNDLRHGKGANYWSNGETYDGDWKDGNMEGKGIYYYNNGEKYEGEWIKGTKTGKGTYYLNDKKVYEGDWKNDIKEGKGIFYYSNGKYDGEWKNNLKEGKGTYYGENEKKIYEGDWKGDKMDGKGILYYSNGRYEGDLKDELKDGKGTYFWDNGDRYEGGWKKNKRDGKGIFSKNNGNKYDGDWKNDLKDGNGIEFYNNGEKYEGNWKKGIKEGKGIYYYNNGDKYDGDWRNNSKNGKGIYYLSDGKKAYDGEWKNDLREGKGIFNYNNGKYEGNWKNDKKEGKGIYYWDNGDKFEGNWKNDLREGKGTFYRKDGTKISGKYSKDELIK